MPRPLHGGHTVMGDDNEASADSREQGTRGMADAKNDPLLCGHPKDPIDFHCSSKAELSRRISFVLRSRVPIGLT